MVKWQKLLLMQILHVQIVMVVRVGAVYKINLIGLHWFFNELYVLNDINKISQIHYYFVTYT